MTLAIIYVAGMILCACIVGATDGPPLSDGADVFALALVCFFWWLVIPWAASRKLCQ